MTGHFPLTSPAVSGSFAGYYLYLCSLVLGNLIAKIYTVCTCKRVCPTRIHKSLCTPPRARRNAVASSHAAQEQQPTALRRSATPIQSRKFKGPVLLPAASALCLYPLPPPLRPLSHKCIHQPIPAHIFSHSLYILHMKGHVCLN